MGERLLDTLNVRNPRLTYVETVSAPGVVHLRFR